MRAWKLHARQLKSKFWHALSQPNMKTMMKPYLGFNDTELSLTIKRNLKDFLIDCWDVLKSSNWYFLTDLSLVYLDDMLIYWAYMYITFL